MQRSQEKRQEEEGQLQSAAETSQAHAPDHHLTTFIKSNQTSLGLGLLGVSCLSLVWSIRKRTGKTRDFGYANIMKNPGIRGNVQHASWLWAIQAFSISTAIVGVGFSSLALGLVYLMLESPVAKQLKDFSVEFRKSIQRKFPSLAVKMDDKQEEMATREFMMEWKGHLESELEESKRSEDAENHKQVISSIIAEGLGPLGKYTRGGAQK